MKWYKGIFTEAGNMIAESEAVSYAMARCSIMPIPGTQADPEFEQALCSWFYSGDWTEVEENELFGRDQEVL